MPSKKERKRYAATGVYRKLLEPKVVDQVRQDDGTIVTKYAPQVPADGDIKRMTVSHPPRIARMTGRRQSTRRVVKPVSVDNAKALNTVYTNSDQQSAAVSAAGHSPLLVKRFTIKTRKPVRGLKRECPPSPTPTPKEGA